MIKSFTDKEAEKIFYREYSRHVPPDIHRTALRKLLMLDAAVIISDLRLPPANRLESLRGKRAGYHSIRINDQWRICFRWHDGNAYEVEIVNYN